MNKEEKQVSFIGNGILNYLKSLRYYFTPVGCFSLFVILGLSIVIPYIYMELKTFGNELNSILSSSSSFELSSSINYAVSQLSSLDWSSNSNAVETLTNSEYIKELITKSIQNGITNYDSIKEEVATIFTKAVTNIVNAILFLFIVIFLGVLTGFFITKIQVRKLTASRKLWKALLIFFVDSLIETLVISLVVYLMRLWKPSVYISLVIVMLTFSFVALLEAYLVQGNKKVKLLEVIKLSTTLKLILTNILVILISFVFSIIAFGLTNQIAGLFISLPFIEIAFIMNNLNAEAYVKKLVEARETTN